MVIKIGTKFISVREYCHAKVGDTENMAFIINGTAGHDFKDVIDKVSDILLDELDKEYDNENS